MIILTARDSAADTVAGLEGGANDYIAKPFSFAELAARVKLRLDDDRGRASQPAAALDLLRAGSVVLDPQSHSVSCNGEPITLSAREFTLLETFMRTPGQVLTREVLLDRVWGYSYDPGSNVVDVYVGYLRRKLGAGFILTVRGAGYRLAADPGS